MTILSTLFALWTFRLLWICCSSLSELGYSKVSIVATWRTGYIIYHVYPLAPFKGRVEVLVVSPTKTSLEQKS